MKRHIPNIITCCNLVCGCCAVGAAFHGHFVWAAIMIVVGAVFDFFDGMVARLLGVSSPIGKELDSLADVVTFGLAPSAMLFQMLGMALSHTPWCVAVQSCAAAPGDETFLCFLGAWLMTGVPYLAFIMAAFSALRLAKFNVDDRQTISFIGLPTPANALFWCSIALSESYIFLSATTLLLLELGMSLLLIAELPLFALKFKSLAWSANKVKYVFLAGAIILIPLLRTASLAAIVVWYIFLSVITNVFSKRT